jgi:AraC-like DNA-binding protein
MGADTLSDVLRSVRLRGAVFYDVRFGGDWAAEVPAARRLADAVMPGVDHVIEYHLLVKGDCWAAVVGEPPVRLATGDVVMFPQGDAHVLSSAPGLRAGELDVDWTFRTRQDPKPIPIAFRGHDALAEPLTREEARENVVCGFLGCDLKPFNPLVATLPRMLHLRASEGGTWIADVMRHAVAECERQAPGVGAMLERISELIFVDAVRRYVDAMPAGSTGWLAGLRDRHVGRAIAALHSAPARDWTTDALASEAGLSRSALHDRFVQLLAMPPMQYLAQWRMQVASGLLRASNANVASVALDVGYESEAAFARAFKRLVGMPPAAWRRTQATPVIDEKGVAA